MSGIQHPPTLFHFSRINLSTFILIKMLFYILKNARIIIYLFFIFLVQKL